MSGNIYVIQEISNDEIWDIGYHADLKTAEEYLVKLQEIDSMYDDHYYFIQELENLEDVGYLNGKFEEYEIDDNWDEYDERWDEYHGMYSTDFEPFKKKYNKQRQLDEWD